MSIHIDGKKITAMYWGGQKIREAWYEGRRVFSGEPVKAAPTSQAGAGIAPASRSTTVAGSRSNPPEKRIK